MSQEYTGKEVGLSLRIATKKDKVSLDIPDSSWEKDGWLLTPLSPLTVRITHLIGHSVYTLFFLHSIADERGHRSISAWKSNSLCSSPCGVEGCY